MSTESTPAGTLQRNTDGSCEGRLQRLYVDHDRAEVWDMLTRPELMALWLAPGTIELHEGGAVNIDFEDSGIAIASEVLEFTERRLLAYSWSSGDEPQRPLRWQLEDADGGTQLTLTVGLPAGEDAAKACFGFDAHLEMLAGALEGVPLQFPVDLFLQARAAYGRQLDADNAS